MTASLVSFPRQVTALKICTSMVDLSIWGGNSFKPEAFIKHWPRTTGQHRGNFFQQPLARQELIASLACD
jgi:hypothetical protein